MSQPGKPSTAHVFVNGICVYCGTHKANVDRFSLECTREREIKEDQKVKKNS